MTGGIYPTCHRFQILVLTVGRVRIAATEAGNSGSAAIGSVVVGPTRAGRMVSRAAVRRRTVCVVMGAHGTVC